MKWIEALSNSQIAVLTIIVSGTVSLLVAWVSNWVGSRRAKHNREYERKVFLRSKYEEFGNIYGDILQHYNGLTNCKSDEVRDHLFALNNYSNRLNTLAMIYFDELEKPLAVFLREQSKVTDNIMLGIDYHDKERPISYHFDNLQEIFADYGMANVSFTFEYKKYAPKYTSLK